VQVGLRNFGNRGRAVIRPVSGRSSGAFDIVTAPLATVAPIGRDFALPKGKPSAKKKGRTMSPRPPLESRTPLISAELRVRQVSMERKSPRP
jgi:hypothetical protein